MVYQADYSSTPKGSFDSSIVILKRLLTPFIVKSIQYNSETAAD